MSLSHAPFLLLLLFISAVFAFQGKKSDFLTKTLEKTQNNEKTNDFITINLKQAQITSKQKHEIFDFVSKSQSYLFSTQEKNIMLSTERKFKAASNSEMRMQKISLYNFKNTQVKNPQENLFNLNFLVHWCHFPREARKHLQCDL